MRRLWQRVAGALCAAGILAVAGCGAPPTSSTPSGVSRAASPLVAPTPAPGAPARPEAEILAKVAAALNTVTYMEGEVAFKESVGGKEEHGKAHFSFRRQPFAARIDIEDSNKLLAAGSSVLWHGGADVQIKRKGIPLTVNFPADHSLVLSLRGYRIDQTDIFSMGKVLLAPGAEVRPAGRLRVEDGERIVLEVVSPASARGISRERIGLDPTTYVPTYREMFAGTTMVHRGIGKKLVLNRRLDADRFKL